MPTLSRADTSVLGRWWWSVDRWTLGSVGLLLGFLFGSVVIIENVFLLPGVGSLLLVGIINRDYPVLLASALCITVVALVANLVVDLIGAMLDPRQVRGRGRA